MASPAGQAVGSKGVASAQLKPAGLVPVLVAYPVESFPPRCCTDVTNSAAQIVYEFLLRYVVCQDTDAKAAKKYIDQVGHEALLAAATCLCVANRTAV